MVFLSCAYFHSRLGEPLTATGKDCTRFCNVFSTPGWENQRFPAQITGFLRAENLTGLFPWTMTFGVFRCGSGVSGSRDS